MIEKKELNQLCLEWEPDKTGNGMTKAMPFLRKYDITFLRPPTICTRDCVFIRHVRRF